jgi:hypothetical protein
MMKHSSLVLHPNPQDVVLGKDKKAYHHPGNVAFRQLVKNYLCYYALAKSKSGRTTVAQALYDAMKRSQSYFLKPALGGVGWVRLDEASARFKVSHALRDKLAYSSSLEVTMMTTTKPGSSTPPRKRSLVSQNMMLTQEIPSRRYFNLQSSQESVLAAPMVDGTDLLSCPNPHPAKRHKPQSTIVVEEEGVFETREDKRPGATGSSLGSFVLQAEHHHYETVVKDDFDPITDFASEGPLRFATHLNEALSHPNVAVSEQRPILLDYLRDSDDACVECEAASTADDCLASKHALKNLLDKWFNEIDPV